MVELLSDAQIMALFPTPIMQVRWDEAERHNPDLVTAILEKERSHPGVNRSNKGGWHSKDDLPQWAGEAGKALLKFAIDAANKATKQVMMGHKLAPFRWNVLMWANVNRSGQFNAAHIHPRSTWSGVYYADPGDPDPDHVDNGILVLHNPKGTDKISFLETPIMPLTYHVTPEAGLAVLFPSHLVHSVNPYFGTRQRISISFNLMKDPYP